MSPPDNWSRINEGRPELIDHILISHTMSQGLLEASAVPLAVPSVGMAPQLAPRAAGEPPSDHRPVLARFDL